MMTIPSCSSCCWWTGNLEAVKHLMANGADPNLRNNKGQNALHRASAGGQLEVVEHLMANGADPNLKNDDGETALHE